MTDEDSNLARSSEGVVFNNVSIIISKIGYSRVLIADMQILASALLFGLGFIGQRAVSVEGLGPMTCNVRIIFSCYNCTVHWIDFINQGITIRDLNSFISYALALVAKVRYLLSV